MDTNLTVAIGLHQVCGRKDDHQHEPGYSVSWPIAFQLDHQNVRQRVSVPAQYYGDPPLHVGVRPSRSKGRLCCFILDVPGNSLNLGCMHSLSADPVDFSGLRSPRCIGRSTCIHLPFLQLIDALGNA